MMNDHPARHATRLLAPLLLGILVLVAPASAASADDAPAAWSVSPSDATGVLDGRTRLELQLDPGGTATDHVLIANASTTDQTFDVYGADAFNTSSGGFDLLAGGVPSKDAGSWVTVDHQQVTVPALASAVVAVTVAAPATAAAGDHAAGIVVSRAQADGAQGVIVDTRVAVRLSVRISGELAPALTVHDVHVDYGGSLVPFGPSDAKVSYTVTNTGNVLVVGEPRLRLTAPFGVTLATTTPAATQDVLPGESFTVSTTVRGVAPALVDTAVVDVRMAAAPGPDTTIPLVSATSSATFLAVPWTGVLVLVALGLGGWWIVRLRRRRRQEGEAMWADLVEQAKKGEVPAARLGAAATRDAGVTTVGVLLVSAALVGGAMALALGATSAAAADATPTGAATLQLSVPPAPTTPSTTTTTTSTTGTTTTTTVAGGSGTPRRSTPGSGTTPPPADEPQAAATDQSGPPSPSPSPSAAALGADTNWRAPSGFTPAQWGLVSVSGSALLGAGGLGVRAILLARAARIVG